MMDPATYIMQKLNSNPIVKPPLRLRGHTRIKAQRNAETALTPIVAFRPPAQYAAAMAAALAAPSIARME